MNKLITIILLLLSLNVLSQDSTYTKISAPTNNKVNVELYSDLKSNKFFKPLRRRECEELPLGLGFMLGGSALIIMGATEKIHPAGQPFFQQGPRMLAIMSGSAFLVTGFVFTMAGY